MLAHPKIYKITTGGALVSTFDVVAAGSPVNPNALAFDAKRNGIWFGGQSCTESGMPIQFWDFDDNSVTLMFTIPSSLTNPATGESFLSFCFDDGLAYNENDPSIDADDEIWFSDDVNHNLGLFRPDGTLVAGYDARTINSSLELLSGLAIGGKNIYMANNGGGDVFRVDKDTFTLVDQFVSGDERQEDMECDPDTFAPTEVMWVRTTPQGGSFPNVLRAYEIEPGTCGKGGLPPPPPEEELIIKKFVKLDDKGITVDETVSFLKKAHIVEATLKDPKHNLYVYKNIPLPVPAHIPWGDKAWEPLVKLFDGKWELKLQIIAVYEDPKTKELKQVEQKIIIHFTVVKGMISVFHDDPTQPPPPLELNKLIKVTPHPAQLNGKINIEMGEKVMPKARDVFVTEVTLAKPSGTVVSYTKLPVHITVGNANIPFPGPDWSAGGFNPTIALDELGMWELDIEIIAFYYDGTTEIRKINQKLWISFNVIPEHILPMLAVIAPLGVLALYMYRKKHEMYSNTDYNL